jgi:hypothetical protein
MSVARRDVDLEIVEELAACEVIVLRRSLKMTSDDSSFAADNTLGVGGRTVLP